MSAFDREALVERMAIAIAGLAWVGASSARRAGWRGNAMDALAIAEPTVREDEREKCAAMVETSLYIMSGSGPSHLEYNPKRAKNDNHHATIAAAIRALD